MDRNFSSRLKKSLGQNFLTDEKVIEDLISAAEVEPQDAVLEVGAGTGNVTMALAKRSRSVIAVEIDKNLVPILRKNLEGYKNVKIINEDILKFRISDLGFRIYDYKVVGSIPYQITSPLIHKLLTLEYPPSLIAIIIQKEVAEKIVAKPPRATYLSCFVKAQADAKIIKVVSPKAFKPQPKVWSAILRIELKEKDIRIQGYKDIRKFRELLHQGFMHPRKMMKKKFDEKLLKKARIDPARRAENLTFEEWLKLFTLLG